MEESCTLKSQEYVESPDGLKEWLVNGDRHRLDGPAAEWIDGTKEWCVDGRLHRLDGPAVEEADGSKTWWIDGEQFNTEEIENWLEENNIDLKTISGQTAFKLRWV